MFGADVDELASLSRRFGEAAEQFRRISEHCTRLLGTTVWSGDDASHFDREWQDHRRQLLRVGSALDDVARRVREEADAQRRASAAAAAPSPRNTRIDRARVARSIHRIAEALDTGGFSVTSSDLREVERVLAELTPEEKALVIARLSDEQLAVLRDQMNESAIKGGMSAEQRSAFLLSLLPHLAPADVARLMGPDWAQVSDWTLVHRTDSGRELGAELLARLGGGGTGEPIGEDEIEVQRLDNGRYVVLLPGVVDLRGGLKQGLGSWPALLVPGGAGAAGASVADEWLGPNKWDSARDMRYAFASEVSAANGSETGANPYAFAVKEALRGAGVPPGADVMIVGHSFGAYTAFELATDASFNRAIAGGDHSGYGVNITHVLGSGASAAFRAAEVPPGTQALLLNNANDAAYIAERSASTNNRGSAHEVVFDGGSEGLGHQPSNYASFFGSAMLDDVVAFGDSAYESYGAGGEAARVKVKDAYR